MKYSFALAAASATIVNASCSSKAFEEGGNWFCQAVNQVKYTGVGVPGTYKAVTAMNDDGTCSFADVPFGGALAPLDEELSIHLRGPAKLLQVAVYGKSSKKRDVEPHSKRHGHQRLHQKRQEQKEEKRADMVTATIDGKVVSWVNNYFGPNVAAATPAVAAPAVVAPAVASAEAFVKSSKADDVKITKPKPSTGSSGTSGDYTRAAYYNAASQVADGLVFLGNYGDKAVSGTFDYTFGNSLSYINAAGNGVAPSAEVLANTLIPSNKEFTIMSDKECKGDCGFVRPGSVAYHGFGGADRVMLFEFQMPYDGNRGFNGDMPALWLLNANIPRTLQYGKCSCWPNCAELDVFEVLASGDSKCKTTLHSNASGGPSDFFERPADKSVKVAVVTQADSSSVTIKVLPDSFDFSTSMSQSQVDALVDDTADKSKGLLSLFAIVA